MPAFTPRGYPYSLPTDPTDVPQAIEDLAMAVDADVQERADSVHVRATFRLSSTSPVTFSPRVATQLSKQLPFENQDALVGGGITPVTGTIGRIVPQLPGFWWFQAAMVIPRAGSTYMNLLGLTLQTNIQVLARNSTHLPVPESDGANLMTVTAGTYMNGTTDFVELIGTTQTITPVSGVPPLTIRNRYLLGRRMTES